MYLAMGHHHVVIGTTKPAQLHDHAEHLFPELLQGKVTFNLMLVSSLYAIVFYNTMQPVGRILRAQEDAEPPYTLTCVQGGAFRCLGV